MSGMNTYKEHLQFNENERNVKNIFFTQANFSTYAKILWTHATHAIPGLKLSSQKWFGKI